MGMGYVDEQGAPNGFEVRFGLGMVMTGFAAVVVIEPQTFK